METATAAQWTLVEEKHPPINQVCLVRLEYRTESSKAIHNREVMAIGANDHCVYIQNNPSPVPNAISIKVVAWRPIDLLSKKNMPKVAEFLTEMAKEEK